MLAGSARRSSPDVQQLFLAVARHPGNAHDLARLHLELQVDQIDTELVLARQRQAVHAQHRGTGLHLAVLQRGRLGADHQARQRGVGLLGRVAHARDLAAAQHGAGGA